MGIDASIVIPTYNRASVLKKTLTALFAQKCDFSFEIVVIDDGSTDSTKHVVQTFPSQKKLRYFKQKNSGQGMARNNGILQAKGEIIIFIGDDIIVPTNFVQKHLESHKKYPQENYGVLGFIDWHQNLEKTAFLKWLTCGSSIFGKFGGHQFAYEKLQNKKEADYTFFYTSNISLKKSLLLKENFSMTFKNYGWEDIELGYRLTKKHNLKLVYNPEIKAFHLHQITEDDFRKRMEKIGEGLHLLTELHPKIAQRMSILKVLIFKFLASFPILTFFRIFKRKKGGLFFDFYYYCLSKKYFLKGYLNKLKLNKINK